MLPRFIPIVTPVSVSVFREVSRFFSFAVIPYYSVAREGGFTFERRLPNSISYILSSIMPDEYLSMEGICERFMNAARDLKVDYVVVWDLPTYLNDYELSEKNVYRSIDIIKRFVREGFNVIPLVKGAYPEHIRISASEIFDLGFDVVAFHVSEYLYSEERPWPFINDYSLTAIDFMLMLINEILKFDFREVLLIGGSSPRHYKLFLNLDDRIKLAGYSWFIDAFKGKLYLSSGDIVDVRFKYFECSCESCIDIPPSLRRKPRYIARHNLLVNKYLIEEEFNNVNTSFYDLILEPYEDAVIAAELYVGHRDSLWKSLVNWLWSFKPSYAIFIGPTFHREWSKRVIREWSEFIDILMRLNQIYGTKVILVADPTERNPPMQAEPEAVYPYGLDPRIDALKSTKYDSALIKVSRLLCKAKSSIKVKKYNSFLKPITFEVSAFKTAEKNVDSALEDLKNMRKRSDWLISNYINQPVIDKEYKVATPGVWRLTWLFYTEPKPGIIHITEDGEVKLHEFKVQ